MPPSSRPLIAPLGRRLSQLICGLHGHDTQLEMLPDRLALRCVHCHYGSPGWVLREPPPAPSDSPADSMLPSPPARASAPAQ
jgi:hypothetical protein